MLNFTQSFKPAQWLKSTIPSQSLLVLCCFFLMQCTQDEQTDKKAEGPPTVSTVQALGWDQTSITIQSSVSSEGSDGITERGLVYSDTTRFPTIDDSRIPSGSGIGTFSLKVEGLKEGTLYSFRAYARNSKGLSYGQPLQVATTFGPIPRVEAISFSASRNMSDTIFGAANVTQAGGTAIIRRGFVVATVANLPISSANARIVDLPADVGVFSGFLAQGLQPNTQYFVKAFAQNRAGVAYSEEVALRTSGRPVVSTTNIRITSAAARLLGKVNDAGNLPLIRRGFIWGPADSVPNTILINTPRVRVLELPGGGVGDYIGDLPAELLRVGSSYRFRAFAENMRGIEYSVAAEILTFSFLPVGEIHPTLNGIIFYVNPTDRTKGMVVSLADETELAEWGCIGDSIGTFGAIGQSAASTNNILSRCPQPGIAARLARLQGNQWQLPTSLELAMLYDSLHVRGKGNFSTSGAYWSSTQATDSRAFRFSFAGTGSLSTEKKNVPLRVRAVRSF